MWGHTHVIPAFGRLRQEDLKFKASLSYTVNLGQPGYTVRPCLKNKQTPPHPEKNNKDLLFQVPVSPKKKRK
jgi:hypothetical protein